MSVSRGVRVNINGRMGLWPMASPYAVVARIAALNQLGLSAFARLTGLSTGHEPLAMQLQHPEKAEGLANLLGVQEEGVRALFLRSLDLRSWIPWPVEPYTLQTQMGFASTMAPNDCWLRFCPKCLQGGYHCLVFQLPWVTNCPWHALPLLDGCPRCGAFISMFDVHAIVSSPFRCPKCQRTFVDPGQLQRLPQDVMKPLASLVAYLVRCAEILGSPAGAARHAILLSLQPPSVATMDAFLLSIFQNLEGSAALLDDIGQSPAPSSVTPLTISTLASGGLSWRPLHGAHDPLAGDAWAYIQHHVASSLAEGAQAFVSFVSSSLSSSLPDTEDVVGDLLSKATLTSTQYATQQLAIEWICHASGTLLAHYEPCMVSAANPPDGSMAWLINGPVRFLGRDSAVEVLHRSGWFAAYPRESGLLELSKHAAVLSSVTTDHRLVLTPYGVSDACLLQLIKAPAISRTRGAARNALRTSRWQPRPPQGYEA